MEPVGTLFERQANSGNRWNKLTTRGLINRRNNRLGGWCRVQRTRPHSTLNLLHRDFRADITRRIATGHSKLNTLELALPFSTTMFSSFWAQQSSRGATGTTRSALSVAGSRAVQKPWFPSITLGSRFGVPSLALLSPAFVFL